MASVEFVRLLKDDETWNEFEGDWRAQCEAISEDFDGYAEATFSVVKEIIETEKRRAGVFGLKIDNKYMAMCQVNKAPLPHYDGPVLRVRFMTLCPDLDLLDAGVNEYAHVLISLLVEVMTLAMNDLEMGCKHIKFHLRSPADTQFFSLLGTNMANAAIIETVATKGAWLYISLK